MPGVLFEAGTNGYLPDRRGIKVGLSASGDSRRP